MIDQSGAELDLTTRGTSTLLNSFWLSVYEVSHHGDYELWAGHPEGVPITDEERRRFAEPFPELSSLACHAPVPMQIEVNIPLADEPIISLIAKTTMSNDTCHTTVHLEGGFDRGKQIATSQNWYGGPTPRSPKDLWPSSALFTNANLTDILDHYRVSTIAFRPTRGAFVHVASDNLDDLRQLRSYAVAHLPLALGFHVRPSLDDGKIPLSEFAEERNFVLDTMYSNFSYTASFGTGVTFLYQMAPMRPEWSSRGTTCPGVPAPRIALDNPYREGPAITDPCNPPLRKR